MQIKKKQLVRRDAHRVKRSEMEETVKREQIKISKRLKPRQIQEEDGQDTDNMRWNEIKG